MVAWKLVVGTLTLSVLAGCSQTPRARSIVGPDGSAMLHVSCSGDQGACFELAGQSCPAGYELSPVFSDRDDHFLVRCRLAAVAASAAQPAPAAALANPYPAASSPPPWPPPEQSWATPDPWSTASGATPARQGLPPTHYLPNGQIDVGY